MKLHQNQKMPYVLLLALFILIFTACNEEAWDEIIDRFEDDIENHVNNNCISGSGNVITQTRNLPAYSHIVSRAPVAIFLSQSTTPGFRIEADSNIVPTIISLVSNDTLKLTSLTTCYVNARSIKVFLAVPQVKSVNQTSAGVIWGETKLTGDDLHLIGTGASTFNLELEYDNLFARLVGANSFHLKGKVTRQDLAHEGTGLYNALDLESNQTNIDLGGVGSARVSVSDTLNVSISGIGSVFYRGNPTITQNITGLGRLVKLN